MTKQTRPQPDPTALVKKKIGRPSSCEALMRDRATFSKLLDYLRSGSTLNTAVRAIGLDTKLVNKWFNQGKEQKRGTYKTFREEILTSLGESCLVAENSIRERDPKAYRRAMANVLDEVSPYEELPVHSSSSSDQSSSSPVINSIDLASVLQEWVDAGLITITPQGMGLLGAQGANQITDSHNSTPQEANLLTDSPVLTDSLTIDAD